VLGKIKGKFMVTINDCKLARQLYDDYYIEETTVSYTISTSADARKEYGELIVTNYSPDEFGQFTDKSQKGLGDF
jgi:DNA adenine methylase